MEIVLRDGLTLRLDDEDMTVLAAHKWRPASHYVNGRCYRYLIADIGRTRLLFHRVITACPRGMLVDHINSDGLDNRRTNLRVCTHAENMRNRRANRNSGSGYKGVYFDRGRWRARIRANGVRHRLGSFDTAAEAHAAYCAAADRLHGDFARHE
jgi:hypothetical protein